MTKKPRFEASPDVEKCCDYLRENQDSEIITYSEISAATGRDIYGKDRYILTSARRMLQGERIVFVVETGKGIRRATNSHLAKLSTHVPIRKASSALKKGKKLEPLVNIQTLSEEERSGHYLERSVTSLLEQCLRRALRTVISETMESNGYPVPLDKTIELFSKLKPGGRPD